MSLVLVTHNSSWAIGQRIVTDGNLFVGLLWGKGNSDYLNCLDNRPAYVIEVEALDDKDSHVKFKHGTVVFKGDIREAAAYIRNNGGSGAIVFDTHLADKALTGNYGQSLGKRSSIAGNHGVAFGLERYCVVKAGDYGRVHALEDAETSVGVFGSIHAGCGSVFTAGWGSVISIEYRNKYDLMVYSEKVIHPVRPDVQYRIINGTGKPVVTFNFLREYGLSFFQENDFAEFLGDTFEDTVYLKNNYDLFVKDLTEENRNILDNFIAAIDLTK